MRMGILTLTVVINVLMATSPCCNLFNSKHRAGQELYPEGEVKKPELSYSLPLYEYLPPGYQNPEYDLPLSSLPSNYQRDVVESFGITLSENEIKMLLENGAVILSRNNFEKFTDAYKFLEAQEVPTFVTVDSILYLFNLEFNEILKHLELRELTPMLNSFLDAVIEGTERQYGSFGFRDRELKELTRRNLGYWSVAKKLLDPGFEVPKAVRDEVTRELGLIEAHDGFNLSPLFSLDCSEECRENFLPSGGFSFGDTPEEVEKNKELYLEECSRKCYYEDYSQYVPRGHYTASRELENYFRAMTWLGRMSFRIRGENWSKQAVLLTGCVRSAEAEYGDTIPAYDLWRKIYSVTSFFAGSSDDLTFYDYDQAVKRSLGYGFDVGKELRGELPKNLVEELEKSTGPGILGGFDFVTLAGLKELTQGLRVIGQRHTMDSKILEASIYPEVGPDQGSPVYEVILDYGEQKNTLSRPRDFYLSSEQMEKDRNGWDEITGTACMAYEDGAITLEQLYDVCRLMPTGLDVMQALGSEKARELIEKYYGTGYCNYSEQMDMTRALVESYEQKDWMQDLYKAWLWMLEPVVNGMPEGYPNWMMSDVWEMKGLISALSSWAELRHDTILYVKQSYTPPPPIPIGPPSAATVYKPKYYGYVEPNPEFFARAKFCVDYLEGGLRELGVITNEVEKALRTTSSLMWRLMEIADKELAGEELDESDYDFIKSISSRFRSIITDLASALKVMETAEPAERWFTETDRLEGWEEALLVPMIADVHTESNSRKALEVGTGNPDWVLVIHRAKDGKLGIAVGPVFSYYEFGWPMDGRLTDEKWRDSLLESMERPAWYRELGIEAADKCPVCF
jgi:hypothetical protein